MISFREYDADLIDKFVISDENKQMIEAQSVSLESWGRWPYD